MKFFNPSVVAINNKTKKPVVDQHGNPNPFIRGEVLIVGANGTFKKAVMAKNKIDEAGFAAMFQSKSGYGSQFIDVQGEDGSVAVAIMSDKVVETATREPKEGQRWVVALSKRLDKNGKQRVDAAGRGLTQFSLIAAPIVDLNSSMDDMLAALGETPDIEEGAAKPAFDPKNATAPADADGP